MTPEGIQDRLGIQDISVVMQQMRLRCFGHIGGKLRTGTANVEVWWYVVLQEGEDYGRLGTKLYRTICIPRTLKKHSLNTSMDGEMPSRSHRPTHANMERMLNEEEEDFFMIFIVFSSWQLTFLPYYFWNLVDSMALIIDVASNKGTAL